MTNQEAKVHEVFLKDYQKPEFEISHMELKFDLYEDYAIVENSMLIKPLMHTDLVLNGHSMELLGVYIDKKQLSSSDYTITKEGLSISKDKLQKQSEIVIKTKLDPKSNLSFEGLYKSKGGFFTQCEAEGFRKISYFLDRPDVMTTYSVQITADQKKYPVLLSNGNLISQKKLDNGRHQAIWKDPFKKPSYLFALVAADLDVLEDVFTTKSNRKIDLKIFCQHGHKDQCRFAMESLKKAMLWDEQTFNLEYDLDIFMIVAVDDFNMGAMENKGLNIFNSKYILADPQTATDADFETILSIIGHEYFHNWTGNRVTCRDWFQLSLKEGLTVFRDQEFSADIFSRGVKRIEDVIRLKSVQFAEDAGPTAHPVRPSKYAEINNFYTTTIYEKGAEVIRMIQCLLGDDLFKQGIKKYFELFDGMAVTTDDFVFAMEQVSNKELTQFKNWYTQAGTPKVSVQTEYNAATKSFKLEILQECPFPVDTNKKDYVIPIRTSLLSSRGSEISCKLKNTENENTEFVLELNQKRQVFEFENINEKPFVSLLRGFSAPVNLDYNCSDQELSFFMKHETDSFNRWNATQTLLTKSFVKIVENIQKNISPILDPEYLQAFQHTISDPKPDPAYKSLLLNFPNDLSIMQSFESIDIDSIILAKQFLFSKLASTAYSELLKQYSNIQQKIKLTKNLEEASSLRYLQNSLLAWMCRSQNSESTEIAYKQFSQSELMSEAIGALIGLNQSQTELREKAFAEFYKKWQNNSLVLNKWFSLQATQQTAPPEFILKRIQELSLDPRFDKTNPNKIFELYYRFGQDNLTSFHHKSGNAYEFFTDVILDVDSRNPQTAARLLSVFNLYKRFDDSRKQLIQNQLDRILKSTQSSKNILEVAQWLKR